MSWSRLILPLSLLAACGDGVPQNAVSLDWQTGDEFFVAASYRLGTVMTEENPVDLDGSEAPDFGEAWTDDVTWSYQVVETGLVPDSSDTLRDLALNANGEVEKLAVVRAWLDDSLNDDPELLEADPVVYLVFHERRDRLAAIISFSWRDGERVEQAWSSTATGRSWAPLSQSMLTAVPTYLAPWSARYEDEETTLEDGSLLSTTTSGDTVDVFYDDELGGDLVVSRYEKGAPWPTWTVSENVDARLLSGDEVEAKRRLIPVLGQPPQDFDYRAALSATIDIDTALTLDAEAMDGGWEESVYETVQPWAGSWWPLAEASLVFGYDNRDTLSDRLQSDVDPIKRDMDRLSGEIRELSDGADKTAKVSEYQAKQSELVDTLVAFYGGVLQDLDGGRLTLSAGSLRHTDGWSYDLDELSPMDKLALNLYTRGETNPNPFYLGAWEILNHYNPSGGSWWGHCNGWAAAAILIDEPRSSVTADFGGESVRYDVADVKGLMTESHYSTYSRFYGARYNGESDDISDLTPAAFHKLVSFYIRQQGVPLVFDTSANEEVWNFPAWKVDLEVVETTEGDPASLVNVNTADLATLEDLPGIGPTIGGRIIVYRETNGPFQSKEELKQVSGIGASRYADIEGLVTITNVERSFLVGATVTFTSDGVDEDHLDGDTPESLTEEWDYTLVTDASGLVLRGTWVDERSHPDFAWVPYQNPTSGSSGRSENPYLSYATLLDVLGSDLVRE